MRPEVEFWSAWLYTIMRGCPKHVLGVPTRCTKRHMYQNAQKIFDPPLLGQWGTKYCLDS